MLATTHLEKITLQSQLIKLEPLTIEHLDEFLAAGQFSQLWQYMPINRCQDKATAKAWLQEAVTEMEQGKQLAFITRNKSNNAVVGSSRLLRLNPQDRSIEIGHTFITPKYQRSYVNSHAKYLMLQYAFEVLGMVRVEIVAHEDNAQSRAAITRIGGRFEGILRKNRCLADGNYRNTALFSIIDNDWEQVKVNLLNSGKTEEEFSYVPA